jgi:hypothetical protein
MPDLLDNLKCLDADGLQPVFAQPQQQQGPCLTDRKHIRRSDKAVMLDARRLDNAIEHIGRLPERGEAFHMLTHKRYSMMHLIPATLYLASPAIIDHLSVVTLSFSMANLHDLLSLLDSGQVKHCDFAYSIYFRSNEKENCQRLADELTARGHRVHAGLIHSKILLLSMSDGRSFVVESSANLRSCSSVEQITMYHDRELFGFHRQWISELMEAKA